MAIHLIIRNNSQLEVRLPRIAGTETELRSISVPMDRAVQILQRHVRSSAPTTESVTIGTNVAVRTMNGRVQLWIPIAPDPSIRTLSIYLGSGSTAADASNAWANFWASPPTVTPILRADGSPLRDAHTNEPVHDYTMHLRAEIPRHAWLVSIDPITHQLMEPRLYFYRTAQSFVPFTSTVRWIGGNQDSPGMICWGVDLTEALRMGVASADVLENFFFTSAFNTDLQPDSHRWIDGPGEWAGCSQLHHIPGSIIPEQDLISGSRYD